MDYAAGGCLLRDLQWLDRTGNPWRNQAALADYRVDPCHAAGAMDDVEHA